MSTEENKVLEAKISNKFSGSISLILFIYVLLVLLLVIIGFVDGSYETSRYSITAWFALRFVWKGKGSGSAGDTDYYPGYIVAFIFIMLVLIALPLIYVLICKRINKLTSLTVTETEIIGSYAAFIPISKITLRMPIEKIDNVTAVKNILFLFRGKAIIIRSTSGKVRIYYVENADEVVAFILEAIQNARQSKSNNAAPTPDNSQNDYIESIKKLSELKNAGILTEEEFNKKKNELLNKM